MALQELYGEYKPQGLVGGMVSGLNTGANLGSMFANTASTNQQTTAREQKLPWELSEMAGKADELIMKNDMTRATQPGAIDATNATNTTTKLTQEAAQKLLPIDTFNKFLTQQTQQSAGMLTQAAERLEAGDTSVWKELSAMATSPEAKKAFQDTYNKFGKLPPAVAAQEARKWADKLMSDLASLDPATRLKMWEIAANNAARIQQEKIQASASGSSQPNYNLVFVQKLAQAIREQNPNWSNAQVEAEAVKQYKTITESTSIGDVTFQKQKTMGSQPPATGRGGTAPVQQNSNVIKLD